MLVATNHSVYDVKKDEEGFTVKKVRGRAGATIPDGAEFKGSELTLSDGGLVLMMEGLTALVTSPLLAL